MFLRQSRRKACLTQTQLVLRLLICVDRALIHLCPREDSTRRIALRPRGLPLRRKIRRQKCRVEKGKKKRPEQRRHHLLTLRPPPHHSPTPSVRRTKRMYPSSRDTSAKTGGARKNPSSAICSVIVARAS